MCKNLKNHLKWYREKEYKIFLGIICVTLKLIINYMIFVFNFQNISLWDKNILIGFKINIINHDYLFSTQNKNLHCKS